MLQFCGILAQQTQTNCKIVFKLKLHFLLDHYIIIGDIVLKLLIGEITQKSDIFSLLDPTVFLSINQLFMDCFILQPALQMYYVFKIQQWNLQQPVDDCRLQQGQAHKYKYIYQKHSDFYSLIFLLFFCSPIFWRFQRF